MNWRASTPGTSNEAAPLLTPPTNGITEATEKNLGLPDPSQLPPMPSPVWVFSHVSRRRRVAYEAHDVDDDRVAITSLRAVQIVYALLCSVGSRHA
ncbi:hypothetical protein MRX96_012994 [Rhipicephalus microplus]